MGLVTTLIPEAGFEGARTTAMVCGPEVMMRFVARRPARPRVPTERIHVSLERNMKCAIGHCGHCQLAHRVRLQGRRRLPARADRAAARGSGSCERDERKPKLAVWKFASCDGCQLSLLDFERELVALPDSIEVAYFLEATRGIVEGPYDLSLVEGSVTTPHDAERIREVRAQSRRLVTIGACATSGGHPGAAELRRRRRVRLRRLCRARATSRRSSTSTPISANVHVDFELQGCPVNRHQLLEVISAFLNERQPGGRQSHSVCIECKRAGNVCVMVAHGTPCLGPVTHAGCGALCPSYDRGCYGCFGPMESPNAPSLSGWLSERLDIDEVDVIRVYRTFHAAREPFQRESERLGAPPGPQVGPAPSDPEGADG